MVNTSKIFRITFRVFLLFITISLSLTSLLGSLSAVAIFSNFQENIQIKNKEVKMTWVLPGDPQYPPENTSIIVPFNITNVGYFPLDGVNLTLEMIVRYNLTVGGPIYSVSIMKQSLIISDVIMPLQTFNSAFTATNDTFTIPKYLNATTVTKDYFIMNLDIGAYYSFRMLHFAAHVENLQLNWEDVL